MKKPISIIEYIDSSVSEIQTWEIQEPTVIKAVGFIIAETKEYVTLCRELINGEFRGQVSIPRIAIKEIKNL